MIKAIAQNCAKTKRPTKKIDKINFEEHGPMSVFHLLTLIGVLRKRPQFDGQLSQNLRFWNFWKNEKWLTLNRKISVTKVRKSKIWDDSFLAFSVAFVMVYSVFSVGAVFIEKFTDQNRHFWTFSKNSKKGVFVRQNSTLRNFVPQFFISPSSWPVRATFCTPELCSGTQKEDYQQWSPSDQKWSFLIIHPPKVCLKSPVRFSTTPLASLAGLNKYINRQNA